MPKLTKDVRQELKSRGFMELPINEAHRTVPWKNQTLCWVDATPSIVQRFFALRLVPVRWVWHVELGAELQGMREQIVPALRKISNGPRDPNDLLSRDNYPFWNWVTVRGEDLDLTKKYDSGDFLAIPRKEVVFSEAIKPVFDTVWERDYLPITSEEKLLQHLLSEKGMHRWSLMVNEFCRIAQIAYLAVLTRANLDACYEVVERNVKGPMRGDSYGMGLDASVFHVFCEEFRSTL